MPLGWKVKLSDPIILSGRDLWIFQILILVRFPARFFKKFGPRVKKLTDDADQLFNYGDNVNLKMFSYGCGFMVYLPVAPIRADLYLYLHCPEDFFPPEQIEGHLPEENINGILGKPRKTGARGIVVQVA